MSGTHKRGGKTAMTVSRFCKCLLACSTLVVYMPWICSGQTRQSAVAEGKLSKPTVTLESPQNGWKFAVGTYCASHHGCHIIVRAKVRKNGWSSSSSSFTVRYYRRVSGGSTWNVGGDLTARTPDGDEVVYTAEWNTDQQPRGRYDLKVELWVDDQLMHTSANQPTVICAKPTWPNDGAITLWLHLHGGPHPAVDVDVPGQGCDGSAPLLAAEHGTAGPHQFRPSVDSCGFGDCLCNAVNYGSFRVAVTDTLTPKYRAASLETDHWHMDQNTDRVSGEVAYHDSIGNGGSTGHSTGSHLHYIMTVGNKDNTPDRDGPRSSTTTNTLLHPKW